jgi:hypothetical protein
MKQAITLSSLQEMITCLQEYLAVGSLFTAKEPFAVYDHEYTDHGSGRGNNVESGGLILVVADTFLIKPRENFFDLNDNIVLFHSVTPILANERLQHLHLGLWSQAPAQHMSKRVVRQMLKSINLIHV